jgi:DNA repair protein RecO
MDRNESAPAIVVKTDIGRGSDKTVTLLSPDWGVVKVTVYGARKSIKSVRAPLYTEGVFNLYHVRDKNRYSLVDLTSISAHERIGESYEASAAAAFMSELILLQRGTDSPSYYNLFTSALDYLEDFSYYYKRTLVQFLLRYLALSGFQPDFEACPVCLRGYREGETLGFNTAMLSPCCSECDDTGLSRPLPPNARAYLRDSAKVELKEAMTYQVSEVQTGRILRYLTRLAQNCLGVSFKSLSSGLLD